MSSSLDCCHDLPQISLEPGEVLLSEGETSGKMFVLIDGEVQVLRGDVEVATTAHPGSMFGEMAVLLGTPHTATVKAVTACRFYAIDDAEAFLASRPELMGHVGRLLAHRLQLATGYLADLKRQFAEHGDHLCMVDEVLECMLNQQEPAFRPGGSKRNDDIGPG